MTVTVDELKQIPGSYTNAGFKFELYSRVGDVAIYRSNKSTIWEVHRIRVREAETYTLGAKEFSHPRREILATGSEWGTYGFTAQSEAGALAIQERLLANPPKKRSKE